VTEIDPRPAGKRDAAGARIISRNGAGARSASLIVYLQGVKRSLMEVQAGGGLDLHCGER
jgi:hypothetical protein